MKKLGIIGGMGPWATSYFFSEIVNNTDAGKDNDHIRILIDNNTSIPDRTSAILDHGVSPINEIEKSLRIMEYWGADVIAIPCNTTHFFYKQIQLLTSINILNIVDITIDAAENRYKNKKGCILATNGTIQTQLYQNRMKERGVDYLVPDKISQKAIMSMIYDYIKKDVKSINRCSFLSDTLNNLRNEGADYFILGCTELSVLTKNVLMSKYSYIDSTHELAIKAIKECGYKVNDHELHTNSV